MKKCREEKKNGIHTRILSLIYYFHYCYFCCFPYDFFDLFSIFFVRVLIQFLCGTITALSNLTYMFQQ